MARDHQHNPDPNLTAARVVGEVAATQGTPTETDLEAAWAAWSSQIQKVDERGMTLLRAAFEAGWEARLSQQINEWSRRLIDRGGVVRFGH